MTEPRGLLYGKGPSFDAHLVTTLQPDWVVCVNEAVLHVSGPRWLVYCDYPVGVKLSKLQETEAMKCVGVYCPDRDRDLWHRPMCYRAMRPRSAYFEMSRARAMCGGWCLQDTYSSTNGLWLLWLLGCRMVHTSGIGDPDGYHEAFEGRPAVAGEGPSAMRILERVADNMRMELINGCG
jgi:hypothetical protein